MAPRWGATCAPKRTTSCSFKMRFSSLGPCWLGKVIILICVPEGGNIVRVAMTEKARALPAKMKAEERPAHQGAQSIPTTMSKQLSRYKIPTREMGVPGTRNRKPISGRAMHRPTMKRRYRNIVDNGFSLLTNLAQCVHLFNQKIPTSAMRLPNTPHAKLTQSLFSHFQPRR